MVVSRAEVLGMCMGVRRAETLARKAAQDGSCGQRPVFTYGPLIHNPQAVAALEAEGVRVLDPSSVDSPDWADRLRNAIVVIRAHGAPPEVFSRLDTLGTLVVDATCPRVIKSQRKAADLVRQGYQVVIAGDRSHGEVMGILGYAPGAVVAESSAEAVATAKRFSRLPVALIAQLCPATSERQNSLDSLAARVSAIVVVGGKNSANTQRLFLAAKASGKPSWHIERAGELPKEIFSFASVGLTAGASTPDSMVDEVESYLLGLNP
ncbi:MAG: 4-hydroxy-3-methylbut-2-enyl diphosphate reductase [Spirochaetes bacterium]|nr:MAG: 4-hydroxy-3-methylbut-2-enyl diphosphate reductase [Spirochaetota bacterium]